MATRIGDARGRGDGDGRSWKSLARLAAQVRARPETHQTLDGLAAAIPNLTGFLNALLFLSQGETLPLVANTGLADTDRDRLMRAGLTHTRLFQLLNAETSLRAGRLYRVRPPQFPQVADFTPTRSGTPHSRGDTWTTYDTLLVPLRSVADGPLVGLLVLALPDDPRQISDDHYDLIETLGETIVMAIENSQAYHQAYHARSELESGLTEVMRQVEQARRGNFTVEVPVRDSLLGAIADLFNDMVGRFDTALGQMREANAIVGTNAAQAGNLATTVAQDAQVQARQIAEVTAAIITLARAIEAIRQLSVRAAEVAGLGRDYAAEGRSAVEDAVRGMEGVREAALQSSQKVKRLAESLQEIESIVQHMTDFTARTNMLALNASIEAGRAGEHGRAFASIAQEIRTLASNSADAAQQIAGRIRTIQGEAGSVVTAISEGTERVVEQSDRIVDAGTSLQAIAEVTGDIASLNEAIRDSASGESTRTSTLAASMEDILRITYTTHDGVREIAAAMTRFIDLTASLREQIAQFTLRGDSGGSGDDTRPFSPRTV